MKTPTKPRAPSSSEVHEIARRWLAESFRVTLFFSTAVAKSPDLWQRISGTPPDTVTERPAQGIHQSVGSFGKGLLTANQQPGRLDIIYAPKSPGETDLVNSPFVDIGPYAEAEGLFCDKVLGVSKSFDNVIRVGYDSVVLIEDENIIESNKILSRYMPELGIVPETDSDIEFQINRPISMRAVNNLRLNRVFKWQVAEMQLIQVAGISNLPSKLISRSMCRLDLDLSSDALSRHIFSQESMGEIMWELKSEANRLIMSGGK